MENYQKELNTIKTILKQNPKGMTVTDIAHELKINRNSVAKYLDVLLISGQVEMVTFGPAKVFFPSRRIPITALINYTSDAVALIDKNFTITQVDEKFTTLINQPEHKLINHHITTLNLSILNNKIIQTRIKETLDGEPHLIDITVKIKGRKKHLRINFLPTTFEDGNPGIALLIEDKTQQQKLNELSQELATTYETIDDILSIHDQDYTIIKINKAFAEFFGKKYEEIIGKKCYEFVHGLQQPPDECPSHLTQESKQKTTTTFYDPRLKKYLEVTMNPIINKNGTISCHVHIIKNNNKKKNK